MKSNRRNMAILFATMVVVMLGFGIIIPILPFYIESMGASGKELGLLMATYAFMQLIFAPMWGSGSDRIGRKPILLVGVLGNALSLLLMGLASRLWMLFVARILAGVLSSATLPTAMAFVSDSTSDEDRGGGMGLIGAAMGVGMILGPGLGGWLAAIDLSFPFYLAAGLSLLVMIFIYFALPESLTEDRRSKETSKIKGLDVKQLWLALRGPLGYLMFLSFLLSFGMTNFEGIFGLYALERYGYGPSQVGTILVVLGIVGAVVQMGLTGRLTKRWGERRVIQGSLVLSATGFALMLSATSFTAVLLTTGFYVMGQSLLRPALASLVSRRSHRAQQGMALGLHNSFMSMGRIAGPTWAGFAFDFNLMLPYISGAITMLAGLGTTFIWLADKQTEESLDSAVE